VDLEFVLCVAADALDARPSSAGIRHDTQSVELASEADEAAIA
jgi:hypothetical protein